MFRFYLLVPCIRFIHEVLHVNIYLHLHLHVTLHLHLLTHGTLPMDMVSSTVIPIPKGRNGQSDSDNCRDNIFVKILDLIILNRYRNQLLTSDQQFGFKAKRSTNMCTMAVKEVVNYYVNNGSPALCMMLDATKAFDRVHYGKLFNMQVARDKPFVTSRLLLNMYTSHVTKVMWNGIYSCSFLVKNGVEQGSIVSPILFCVYLDELLKRLKDSKL